MPFRSIAIAATAGVILVALFYALVFPSLATDSRTWIHGGVRIVLLAMVAVATGLAANQFGWWSEYLGRAWTLFFVEYGLLVAGEVFRRALPQAEFASEICVVVANLAGIGAYVLMARALRAAGLEYYGSPLKRWVVIALALAVALLLCYPTVVDTLATARTNPSDLVSPVADIITFVLVAPLLLTTFALFGGQLFWTFAFLTVGTMGWMVNQGSGEVVRMMRGGDDVVRAARMFGFAMACFFIAAAAWTQWMSARRAVRGAVHG